MRKFILLRGVNERPLIPLTDDNPTIEKVRQDLLLYGRSKVRGGWVIQHGDSWYFAKEGTK